MQELTGPPRSRRRSRARAVVALASGVLVATLLAVGSLFLSIGNDEAYIDVGFSLFWQAVAGVAVIAGFVGAARAGKRAPAYLTLVGCVALVAVVSMWWAHAYYVTATAYVP